MRCFISSIGVIDHDGITHDISLKPGVNIITGKSSTGKSALIEIVDYCLGSSESTIPHGIITEVARYYYIKFFINQNVLLLAREAGTKKGYVIDNFDDPTDPCEPYLALFTEDISIKNLDDYKKVIGRYFNIIFDNVDEEIKTQTYKRISKSATPSIRSFSSYIFQHQNLIANKHAIFYRFDQKEKRDQAIDHFKIFLGLVDDDYFVLSKQLSSIELEIKKSEFEAIKYQEMARETEGRLSEAHLEFLAITNNPILTATPKEVVIQASKWLDHLRKQSFEIDGAGDEFIKQYNQLDAQLSTEVEALRKLEVKRNTIASSIRYADEWKVLSRQFAIPDQIEEHDSECPFCNSINTRTGELNNALEESIVWLNEELKKSSYERESYKENERLCKIEIENKRSEVRQIELKMLRLKSQLEQLGHKRSLAQVALVAKSKMEALLETLIDYKEKDGTGKIEKLREEASIIRTKLKAYNLDTKFDEVTDSINKYMNHIASHLGLEDVYLPVALHFDLSTFDLFHKREGGSPIYLRSMGSGANWLSCHISLFLAMQYYFCKTVETSKIPPILFLDQPSQVYFPATLHDESSQFDLELIAERAGRSKTKDEDLLAVENLYNVIIQHCEDMHSEFGFLPQIIICDHADNLTLSGKVPFEGYVRKRWRASKAGLISYPDRETQDD